jgi:hypothetical protein
MRKLLALALLALALAGGVVFVIVEHSTPATACGRATAADAPGRPSSARQTCVGSRLRFA